MTPPAWLQPYPDLVAQWRLRRQLLVRQPGSAGCGGCADPAAAALHVDTEFMRKAKERADKDKANAIFR